jgi:hypothetical protein
LNGLEPHKMAMLLLVVVVLVPSIGALVLALRCAVFFIVECLNRPWVPLFRDWLSEIVPVLVAIIMRGGAPPPPLPPRLD